MLYRFQLIIVLYFLVMIPAALSASETAHVLQRAQQSMDEMKSQTSKTFEEADALSTMPEFLDQINRETARMLDATKVPTPTLPTFPQLTDAQLKKARTDVQKLMNQAQAHAQTLANPMDHKQGPQLYVFVSFSMPDITLKRLLTQVERIDGSLILRGLVDDSMAKTKNKITELMEADANGHTHFKNGFAIDPTLFQRFDINQVPSFVLTSQPAARCNNEGCPSSDYVRLSGDSTLEYVLETMVRESPESMRDSAKTLLARMKGGA